MEISANSWQRYIDALRKINDTATEKMQSYIAKNGLPTTKAEMNALIDYAYSVSTTYGEAAATLAAEMYDAIAALSGVFVDSALPAPVAEMNEVAKAVVGTAKIGNEEVVSAAVGRLVKMVGVDTTMQNAIRDGAEWAWIPRGETCAFCIMLASNGWQRASKKALKDGHAEHIHANCDCMYAVRFGDGLKYDFYDPDKYRSIYDNADGIKWRDKLNSMRRDESGG